MSKCYQAGRSGPMWEGEISLHPGGGGRAPAAGVAAPVPTEIEGQWLSWRRRLWRELSFATVLYGLAHLLFSLRWVPDGLPNLSMDLLVGHSLFVLGTLLLAKVTQTLHEPIAARHPEGLKQAGSCLAITMLLCLSPCVWWLLSRL